jgi:hypothetical protein
MHWPPGALESLIQVNKCKRHIYATINVELYPRFSVIPDFSMHIKLVHFLSAIFLIWSLNILSRVRGDYIRRVLD